MRVTPSHRCLPAGREPRWRHEGSVMSAIGIGDRPGRRVPSSQVRGVPAAERAASRRRIPAGRGIGVRLTALLVAIVLGHDLLMAQGLSAHVPEGDTLPATPSERRMPGLHDDDRDHPSPVARVDPHAGEGAHRRAHDRRDTSNHVDIHLAASRATAPRQGMGQAHHDSNALAESRGPDGAALGRPQRTPTSQHQGPGEHRDAVLCASGRAATLVSSHPLAPAGPCGVLAATHWLDASSPRVGQTVVTGDAAVLLLPPRSLLQVWRL